MLTQSCQQHLRTLIPTLSGVRWVNSEKYHVTLKFLGDDVKQDDLSQYWHQIAKLQDAFPVQTRVIGFSGWPNPQRARVLVLLLEYKACLGALHSGPRPFVPHITVGYARKKTSVSVPYAKINIKITIPPPALFESVQGKYRKLEPVAR